MKAVKLKDFNGNTIGAGLNGVTVSGTPTNGQVLTASSGTAASWQSVTGSVPSGGLYNWDLSGPSSGWVNTGTGASVVPTVNANELEQSAGLWFSRKTGVRGFGATNEHWVEKTGGLFSANLQSSSLTIEAYIMVTQYTASIHYPLVLNDTAGYNAIYIDSDTNSSATFIGRNNSGTYYGNSQTLASGRPTHVAIVLDRTNPSAVQLTTYYDGVVVLTVNLGSFGNFTANFSNFQSGYNCAGIIGWWCLRDVALTAAQVRANTLILKNA